jgi:hypothetical protein
MRQGLPMLSTLAPKNCDFKFHRDRRMSTRIAGKFRRSTRVPLRIVISVQGLSEPVSCNGETVTVNRHGALIVSAIPLHIEVKIEILVVRPRQRANAKVVYVDPDRPRVCGIALEKPENIWGVIVPPDDWSDNAYES